MVDPVGFRFHPTDEEIVEHYVRPKNLDSNTSRVDEVMNTVDIYSSDPWELPRKSRIISTDQVWYYFGCKKNQHNRGERQSRKTNSGFWKKTGVTLDIKQKRGNREKIGEKRVLVFLSTGSKSKSDWVMHEYVATFLPPTQTTMMTYTVCKVIFKGDPRDLSSSSSSSRGGDIEHDQDQSIIPHVNNSCGGLSTETEGSSFELHDPRQFSGFLHMEEEARLEDATRRVINNMSTDDWKSFLNNDDNGEDEQGKAMFMQEDRNDRNDDNGVFIGHSDDDSDSDSIS